MKKSFWGLVSAMMFCGVFFILTSCNNESDVPVPTPVEPEKEDNVAITDTTVLEYYLFGVKSEYVRVNYTYNSVDADGFTPRKLSSALVFSKDLFERKLKQSLDKVDGKQYDATGLMLIPHFTIACADEAPTKTKNMEIEGPLTAMTKVNDLNYILVSPDFSGFGVAEDEPQAYMVADATAKQALDGLDAAKTALKKMSYTFGSKQILIGYSQGGHTAMAIQRMLSTTSVVQPFDLTCAGGGPYDLVSMVDSILLPDSRTKYPCAIPLMFVETGRALQLDLDYSKIFREALSEKIVSWISSKKLTTSAINDSIYHVLGADPKEGAKVSDILNMDYVKRSNPELNGFFYNLDKNTLTKGWTPISGSFFYMFHSYEDQVVPFFCFEHMRDYLETTSGSDITLKYDKTGGEHQSAAQSFVIGLMVKLLEIHL